MTNVFGKRLKRLRQEKDVVLVDLADHLDTTQSTLSKYENGKRVPNIEMLDRIAKYFDVTTDFLIGNTDTRQPYNYYPGTDESIVEIRKTVLKYGYDIKDMTNDEISRRIVKALKLDELDKF